MASNWAECQSLRQRLATIQRDDDLQPQADPQLRMERAAEVANLITELDDKQYSRIEKLPSDVKRALTDFLEPDDLYSFKMASKKMRQTTEFARRMGTAQWVRFNEVFEKKTKILPLGLACTLCHRILRPSSFSDNQRTKTVRKTKQGRGRFCLQCGIARGVYKDKIFKVDGVRSFVCEHQQVVPLPGCTH